MKKILAALGVLAVLATAAPAMAQSVIPTYTTSSGYTTSGYTTAYAPSYPSYCPTLSYNLYSPLSDYYTQGQVSALQRYLSALGYYQPVTGYYGSITTSNVAQFQRQYGIYPITGGVGPITRSVIAQRCQGTNGGGSTTQSPVITSVTPTYGPTGTVVTIQGYGFSNSNVVHFGNGGSMQVPSFYNGTTIYYTIPSQVSGCDIVQTFAVCAQYVQLVTPGTYQLYVSNGYGQSSATSFSVTGNGSTCTYNCNVGGMTVSSPSQGQTYSRGQAMTINWGYPVTPGSTQVMLELYTASGSRVGLIAVSSNTSGSYSWNIPGFPQTYACTAQYPNGLCGTNIPDGQYYIKVSATNDPFDANPNVIASGQSGTFSITGAGTSGSTSFSVSSQSGTAPFTVQFTSTGPQGTNIGSNINFGDGTSGTLGFVPVCSSCNAQATASHTYYNRGTYTAQLLSSSGGTLGSINITAY